MNFCDRLDAPNKNPGYAHIPVVWSGCSCCCCSQRQRANYLFRSSPKEDRPGRQIAAICPPSPWHTTLPLDNPFLTAGGYFSSVACTEAISIIPNRLTCTERQARSRTTANRPGPEPWTREDKNVGHRRRREVGNFLIGINGPLSRDWARRRNRCCSGRMSLFRVGCRSFVVDDDVSLVDTVGFPDSGLPGWVRSKLHSGKLNGSARED